METTTDTLAPFFENRGARIVPDLSFPAYQALPGVNASLLRQPTPYEQLSYLLGMAGLNEADRALLEMSGASTPDVVSAAESAKPRMVPVKLVKLVREPTEKEKLSEAQETVLSAIRGRRLDSREIPATTLSSLLKKGLVEAEDSEAQEVAISPTVRESRAQSLAIGTATHRAILEPHLFDASEWRNVYQLSPTAGLTTKLAQEQLAEDPTRELVTPEIIDTARRCRDAVYRHCFARELLEQKGRNEVTLECYDEDALAMRKARLDRLPDDPELGIIDVKTTHTNLLAHPFRSSVYKFGYHLQAAFYLDTLAMIEGRQRSKFYMIAVTKESPFLCRVFELAELPDDQNLVIKGRDIYIERFVAFSAAYFEKSWNAYENEGALSLSA